MYLVLEGVSHFRVVDFKQYPLVTQCKGASGVGVRVRNGIGPKLSLILTDITVILLYFEIHPSLNNYILYIILYHNSCVLLLQL